MELLERTPHLDAMQAYLQEAAAGEGRALLMVHNLSPAACTAELSTGDLDLSSTVEIFGDQDYGEVHEELPSVRLGAYGYRWLRCTGVRL